MPNFIVCVSLPLIRISYGGQGGNGRKSLQTSPFPTPFPNMLHFLLKGLRIKSVVTFARTFFFLFFFQVLVHCCDQGRIQRLKKGGHARRTQLPVRALASFPGPRAFVARSTSLKSLRTRLHSLVGRSGGVPPPQENFENLDRVRVLLRPSETTTIFVATGVYTHGDSSYCRFTEPLPFGINLCV